MTAIYKKELKSYLTSMIGYLFMAFTLALFGLYFTAINLPGDRIRAAEFRIYSADRSTGSDNACPVGGAEK